LDFANFQDLITRKSEEEKRAFEEKLKLLNAQLEEEKKNREESEQRKSHEIETLKGEQSKQLEKLKTENIVNVVFYYY
jgi:hypothetical protein